LQLPTQGRAARQKSVVKRQTSMKITDLEVIRLRSPETPRPIRPAWTPGGSWVRREAVLVRVDTDEGIVGWGAINAQDSAAVGGGLKPTLIRTDPFAPVAQHP